MTPSKYIMPCDTDYNIHDENLLEEKKSKFYSYIYYIETELDAKNKIKELKNKYNDAKHVVYAYRLKNIAKYSDDKEPQNTAGKPIYDILEKRNIVNVLIIIVRYFGGTLLGTGLLTRTYKASAIKAIDSINFVPYVEYNVKEKVIDYKEENDFINGLNKTGSVILDIKRDEKVKIKYKEKI